MSLALLSCLRRSRLRVCCGNPLDVPYVESFDYYWNYAISKSLILGPVKSRKTGSYTVLLEEGMPALKGSDPLDGYLLITADKTQSTSLTFPLVDIQNLTSPVCIVNFLREPENRDVKVEFQTEGPNGIRLLKLFNLKELPNVGWNVVSVDLSSLKTSGENVKLAFTFNDSKTALYLDRVYIGEQNKADLAIADLRVNPAVEKGSPVKISATVLNYAGVPSGSYTAELYRSKAKVDSKTMQSVPASTAQNIEFTDLVPVVGNDSLLSYGIRISLPNDVDGTDNKVQESEAVAVNSVMPPVRNALNTESSHVNISWEAPDVTRIPKDRVTESFETYSPWTTNLSPWLNIDCDKARTNGFQGLNDSVIPKENNTPFIVFSHPRFPSDVTNNLYPIPGGGNQFLIALNPIPPEKKAADDWLISPELNGCAQTIDLYELSFFTFNSEWVVLYSTTGRDTADFMPVRTDGQAMVWKRYAYQLPEGSKYFALRSRISGTPPLQAFDNVSYIPAGQGTAKLKGYNVYYNGKLLNSAPLTECKYKNDGPAGTYLVTALYDNGESMPFPVKVTLGINDLDDDATATSVNTGIGSIIIEATPGSMANIYSISGNKIADVPVGTGSATVSVQPGCYLVRVGRTTAKVMVR